MNYALELAQKYVPSDASKKIKSCGYFHWGFMADVRMKNGKAFSSPDGSLLHFFSIIHELRKRNIQVCQLSVDRDRAYVNHCYSQMNDWRIAFQSFSQQKRASAYIQMFNPKLFRSTGELDPIWPDVDVVLTEWRMPTRYNQVYMNDPDFEPDLILQKLLIDHYTRKGTPIICLDLDYKMTEQDDQFFHYVFEPGFKRGAEHHIDVPYVLEDINQFQRKKPRNEIVYIGNRYERDFSVHEFFDKSEKDINFHFYGNWLENNRNSDIDFPHINFHDRLQPYQLRDAYKNALATPLLLKDEYNSCSFMSIRLIESLLFGTLPMLPIHFKNMQGYNIPEIENHDHMIELVKSKQYQDFDQRESLRKYIFDSVKMHDAKYFVNKMLSVL